MCDMCASFHPVVNHPGNGSIVMQCHLGMLSALMTKEVQLEGNMAAAFPYPLLIVDSIV